MARNRASNDTTRGGDRTARRAIPRSLSTDRPPQFKAPHLGRWGIAIAVAILAAAVAAAGPTQYEYDALGRLTRAYDPAGIEITYTYDPAGNVTGRTVVNVAASDTDGDGVPDAADCAAGDPSAYPGAPEINDGHDNQCDGDAGYGLVDEVDGLVFSTAGDNSRVSWNAQIGATQYQLGRWSNKPLIGGCQSFPTSGSSLSDPSEPLEGDTFFYVVRAFQPHAGSWGRASSGERQFNCP